MDQQSNAEATEGQEPELPQFVLPGIDESLLELQELSNVGAFCDTWHSGNTLDGSCWLRWSYALLLSNFTFLPVHITWSVHNLCVVFGHGASLLH